jgi:hypothetical protein
MGKNILAFLRRNAYLKQIVGRLNDFELIRLMKVFRATGLPAKALSQSNSQMEVMGSPIISKTEWDRKKLLELSSRKQHITLFTSMQSKPSPIAQNNAKNGIQYEISVIVSIYQPGGLLDSFFGNLMEQSIFDSTEVILVLVDPIASEIELASKFAEFNPNVILEIVNSRITIYRAWNLAIERCSTAYITNMNVDDLRSPNSLEVQLKFMQARPWVDVGYQDFFYLLDRDLDWTSVVNIGAISQSPVVTLTELAWFGMNPPHNGPIWKRDLHSRVGLFDENFRSAGDYEFWLRVIDHGGNFAKMLEPTVGYYINPDGMSTSAKSPSTQEEQDLQKKYRSIINLKSSILPDINLNENYANHPWDGAETLTEIVLEKLRVVG